MFAKKSFIGGILAVALVLGTSGAALADASDPSAPSTQAASAPVPAPAPPPAPAPEPAPEPPPAPAPAVEPVVPAPEPLPAPEPPPAPNAATTQQLQAPAPAQRSTGATESKTDGEKDDKGDKDKTDKEKDNGDKDKDKGDKDKGDKEKDNGDKDKDKGDKDKDKGDKDRDDDCDDDDSKRGGSSGKDDDCRDDDDDCDDDDSKRGGNGGKDDDDCSPEHGKKAQIKLVKVVINDDGGEAHRSEWALKIRPDGGNWQIVPQATWTTVPVGTYKLSESDSVPGYDWTKLECTDSKSTSIHKPVVTLSKGAKVECTFTNDDRERPTKKGELKLIKKVVNDDGGEAGPGDWDLQVLIGGTWVTHTQGVFYALDAGTYQIRESTGPDGYDLSGVSCTTSGGGGGGHDDDDDGKGKDDKDKGDKGDKNKGDKKSSASQPSSGGGASSVTIVKGAKVECTFTNDDRARSTKKGELKLIKKVVNDDGGEAGPGDWDLQVLIGGTWVTHTQGVFYELDAGTYQIRESTGPSGYEFTGVSCTPNGTLQPGGSVKIAKGAKVECTFTNDDRPSDPSVGKTIDGLVHVGPGPVWDVSYLLTVDNSGQPHSATYTLFEAPNFPSGITTQGVVVVDVTNGNTTVPWNGQAATPIVTDALVGADAQHVYRVTFTVSLTGPIGGGDRDCVGGPGRGLFNTVTLEWPGGSDEAEACEPVPAEPVFDKVALGATAVDADTWALEYRLSVTNPGPGSAAYTLSDTIGALPSGVTLVEAAATADPAYPQTPSPLTSSWTTAGAVPLALGQPIAQGVTHAFLVTVFVDVVVAELPETPGDCADVPGTGYPIPNLGTIEVDGIIIDDEACNVIQIVDLGIVKTHSTLEGGAVEPGVPFTYVLEVTNHGTGAVTNGVVTDEIPGELTVLSVTAPSGWTDASSGNTVLVQDVALAVGASDEILVEVLLEEAAAQVPPVLAPDGVPAAFAPDFIDELVNTACVAVPDDGNPLNDCSTDTVPVDEILADISVQCVNDVAFLNYAVATSQSLAGQPISFAWTPNVQVPSPQPPSVERTLASGDSGTILWPGARLAPNDVSIQWPGYRPLTISDYDLATGTLLVDPELVYNGMVLDTSYPTYPWRFASTITLSVNPTLSIETEYPDATVNCEVPRSADLIIDKTANVSTTAPGASFQYGLSVTNLAVDSVAEPVVVTDIIPADIRVDDIVTSETAFPRWRDCAVTGADAGGFGGVLECSLLGPLAMGTTAPLITLGVTVRDTTTASSITNTGEVCWGPATGGQPYQACDDDSVTVTLSGLPPTGGEVPAGALVTGVLALLAGLLCLIYGTARRRQEARHDG